MNKILYYLQWNQDLTLTHTFIHNHDLMDFVVISTGDAFIFTVYKEDDPVICISRVICPCFDIVRKMDPGTDVDKILHSLGKFGKYQKIQLCMILIFVMENSFHLMATVFIGKYISINVYLMSAVTNLEGTCCVLPVSLKYESICRNLIYKTTDICSILNADLSFSRNNFSFFSLNCRNITFI
jgi:hypothetical protein